MPFRSKQQMKACFAKKDPKWDCHKWAHETDLKHLPKRKKKQIGGHHIDDTIIPGVTVPYFEEDPYRAPDPLDAAMDRGLIQPSDDFKTAREMYDFYTQKADAKKQKSPMSRMQVSNTIRAAGTAASYIGNLMENKRQNQYMYQQLSSLGQLNPIPVENFQPNPYNLYARQGARVGKKWMKKIKNG